MKKILILVFLLTLTLVSYAKADSEVTFKVITESDPGEYIGQNQLWNLSNTNNSTITINKADNNLVSFSIKNASDFYLDVDLASENGKTLSPGLYSPASRYPFQGSQNGISISGNGRGCNKISGAFYVHEYVMNNGILEKAAIDFIQICEPSADNINSNMQPKLYGSLRYNSNFLDSCNDHGCSGVRTKLNISDYQLSSGQTNNSSQINNNSPISNNNNPNLITSVSDLPKVDAYKAIVKVNSYALNEDNELENFSSGSGVMINSSGMILTNHHVTISEDDFDGTERDSAYIICLTEEIDREPECKYTAKLIASDKDLDVALLKIENISGYSNKSVFSFLNLNTTDSTSVNDEVVTLGYPTIGGSTITITKGVISGKETKYNKSWLKTDAIISYGSSGGAAIDSKAGIIGITSESHSDTLGSLGYIINAVSLNNWVNSNIGKSPRISSLNTKTEEFAKKTFNIKNSNDFINNSPAYQITKSLDWDFTHEDETGLIIDKNSDDAGGFVVITANQFPYNIDANIVEAVIKRELSTLISMGSIIKNEDVNINGRSAKKVLISLAGQQQNFYYIPHGNYLLKASYSYGENDKDKVIVDNIIGSLSLINSEKYLEKTEYTNKNPKFSIKLGSDWTLLPKNSKDYPLFITYKPSKTAFIDIAVSKTDSNTKDLNNLEYLAYLEQKIKELNSFGIKYDLKWEISKKDANYKLNNNLQNIVMLDVIERAISTNEIIVQSRQYSIKTGDYYIVPSLSYYSNNTNSYNDIVGKFNNMLSSLSLESQPLESQPLESSPTKQINQTSSKVSLEENVSNAAMYNNLKGKIILKVEVNGEAFYINPISKKMHYLGRPNDAFNVMREQGVGINNNNLAKIPVSLTNLTGPDTDGDELPDDFEKAIGTNLNNIDSDGDGHNDYTELLHGYNPLGSGKLKYDLNFNKAQAGKILLQVENNGEAWYVNPADNKRYFLGRPADAFNVMRNLGLGISNIDFDKLN